MLIKHLINISYRTLSIVLVLLLLSPTWLALSNTPVLNKLFPIVESLSQYMASCMEWSDPGGDALQGASIAPSAHLHQAIY